LVRAILGLALVSAAATPAAADLAPVADTTSVVAIAVVLIAGAGIGFYLYRRRK
jgi:hypothetical protein